VSQFSIKFQTIILEMNFNSPWKSKLGDIHDGFSWVTAVVSFVKTFLPLEWLHLIDRENFQVNECFWLEYRSDENSHLFFFTAAVFLSAHC
jgi:hypothetical protein